MDSKTQVQILAVMSVIGLITGLTVPTASAHSQPNTNNFFTSGTQTICYSESELDDLQFDGSTNQGADVEVQIEKGMDEMSDNTDMNLSETSSCSGYKNWVGSWYSSSTANVGKTSVKFTTSGTEYKSMDFNNNGYVYWTTNGGCSSIDLDLSDIANHEFGHFAGMDHQSGGSSHTMMSSSCYSGYGSIKAADIAFVNDEY